MTIDTDGFTFMLFSTKVSEEQMRYTRYPLMSSKVVLDLKAAIGSLNDVSSGSFLPSPEEAFTGGFCTAADSSGDDENNRELAS